MLQDTNRKRNAEHRSFLAEHFNPPGEPLFHLLDDLLGITEAYGLPEEALSDLNADVADQANTRYVRTKYDPMRNSLLCRS